MTSAPSHTAQGTGLAALRGHRAVVLVRVVLWALLLTTACLHWWIGRFHVHSDGLGYLDVAALYASGQFTDAINGNWSPLYSWLLAFPLALGSPGSPLEAPVMGLVNLALIVLAYAALERLMLSMLRWRTERSGDGPARAQHLPDWLVVGAAGLLAMWVLLDLIGVATRNPDALVVALVSTSYLVALRIGRGREGPWDWVALGGLLGLAYLAKAAMFPVGVVGIVGAWGCSPAPDRLRRARGAALAFACICVPWITALSLKYGHPTFSENGRYNYARFVAHEVQPMHWQGLPPGSGTPTHPARQVHRNPDVFEFDGPVKGTFPPWQDLGYWYGGVRMDLDLPAQAAAIYRNVTIYARIMSGEALEGGRRGRTFPLLLASGLVLLLGWRAITAWRATMGVWLPLAGALGLYALVHVEPRFIATQAWMLATAPLVVARWESILTRRVALLTALLGVVVVVQAQARSTAWNLANEWRRYRAGDLSQASDWQARVAAALREAGVQRGTRFGFVGSSYRFYWARLAHGRVIAEIRQYDQDARNPGTLVLDDGVAARNASRDPRGVDRFWGLATGPQAEVLATFRRVGVEWLVADSVRADTLPPGWRRLGGTSWVALDLR